jgi:hypothetical protein
MSSTRRSPARAYVRPEEVRDLVAWLAMMKRLSTTVPSLNRLVEDPVEADPAKRALRHLGFAEA